MYGQLHYDILDKEPPDDAFTSSREGIVPGDPDFQKLLDYLSGPVRRQIIEDEWDRFRREIGEGGDEENPAVSVKERRADSLYAITIEEFKPDSGAPEAKQVSRWLNELRPDAVFNLASYADCFLAENLVRKIIRSESIAVGDDIRKKAAGYVDSENNNTAKANISFDIRQDKDEVCYLDMNHLAETAEGGKSAKQEQSLWNDAIGYKPARDAVGHTALLTPTAKTHLNITFQNIRSRVRELLKKLGGNKTGTAG